MSGRQLRKNSEERQRCILLRHHRKVRGVGVLCAAGSGLPRPGTAGGEAVWGWHGQRGWRGEGRVVRAAGLGAPSVLCIKSECDSQKLAGVPGDIQSPQGFSVMLR